MCSSQEAWASPGSVQTAEGWLPREPGALVQKLSGVASPVPSCEVAGKELNKRTSSPFLGLWDNQSKNSLPLAFRWPWGSG